MPLSSATTAATQGDRVADPHRPRATRLSLGVDLAIVLTYVAAAVWVTYPLWHTPGHFEPATNSADPKFFEWALIHATRIFTHHENPLATPQLNAPLGVNLMANTGLLGLTIPLVPVTLLFGAPVSLLVMTTGGLAGTAVAWYYVLHRHLVGLRAAAFVGGLFAGFAPGMINHVNGHPNLTAQFLLPFIVWRVLALGRPRALLRLRAAARAEAGAAQAEAGAAWAEAGEARAGGAARAEVGAAPPEAEAAEAEVGAAPAEAKAARAEAGAGAGTVRGARLGIPAAWVSSVRDGVVLGLLVVWQALLNEELLFLAGLAVGLFIVGYAVFRPGEVLACAGTFLRGAVVTVLVAGVLLAYPLWYQFFGPQHYKGLPEFVLGYGTDLASYPAFAKLSLWRHAASESGLAPQPEENTFFGGPLLVALALIVVWLGHRVAVRALVIAGLVIAALSLGVTVANDKHVLLKDGPWGALNRLPLFDSVVPIRLGLLLIPIIAVLLAFSVDAALSPRAPAWLPWIWPAALALALIPIAPVPLPVTERAATPVFFTSGHWRGYVPPGDSVVSADTSVWFGGIDAMNWDNATNQGFALVGGYFLGPDQNGKGTYGPQYRPTGWLLANVAYDGRLPAIGEEQRRQLVEDVRYWHAAIIVLAPGAPHANELHTTLDLLVGNGQRVDDVMLWDVRRLS